MEKTTSKKSSSKASTSKPLDKPPPWYKTPGIEPAIHFYDIEEFCETEEVEEAEILVV